MNLKDDRNLMKKFVKLVEKYPEIYDHTNDGYRSVGLEKAWEEINQIVKDEFKESCNIDELKLKWKGIRSSYNRYKNKLKVNQECQKYYLSDELGFLDPFLRPKKFTPNKLMADDSYFYNGCHEDDLSSESNMEEDDYEIKSEIMEDAPIVEEMVQYVPMNVMSSNVKADEVQIDKEEKPVEEDSEELQFFKCILSDIKGFTSKEKRKFKMGILQLIDDIENERKDN